MKSLAFSYFAYSAFSVISAISPSLAAGFTGSDETAKEIGTVSWKRDLQQIQDTAKRENKPILLLFQEVPG